MAVGGAMSRRAAWWWLLTCTILGLASMHTLGHGRHSASFSAPAVPFSHSFTSAAPSSSSPSSGSLSGASAPGSSSLVSSVIDFLAGGHSGGSHAGDRESDGAQVGAWSVCLAVLVGLTVAVLLLLLRQAGGRMRMRAFSTGRVISRAPPRRGAGLHLATISVMRI
jgi:hypothetical protein